MKTIYLHVGNLKTGTSAIQKFCSDNRSELLDHGYDYLFCARPKNNNTNHGKLPISLIQKYGGHVPLWYGEDDSFESVKQHVVKAIESSSCDNIIISSEEFYRIAGYKAGVVESARKDLQDLFGNYQLKVIMYVREPLEFSKSWYNEVNKANVPRKRFIDFFYFLNDSYLLPHRNVDFWRQSFGNECLTIEPYQLSGIEHIARFTSLIGCESTFPVSFENPMVNIKRDEETLEHDRIRRIMRMPDREEQAAYLRHFVFESPANFKALRDKIERVNNAFKQFCDQENFDLPTKKFYLRDLLLHEESVNRNDYPLELFRLKKSAKFNLAALGDYLKKLRDSMR
ncbi:MAG: hypothetical protein ABJN62_13080 [Halioglobus sp.]